MRAVRSVVSSVMAAFVLMAQAGPAAAQAPAQARSGAEAKMHRVVFQLSSDAPAAWDGLLSNVENLQAAFGPGRTEVEIVAHGPGIGFLLGTNTAQAPRMEALSKAGVAFVACENTLHRKKLERSALLPFVTTVPAGIAEIVLKQEAGWAYVKAGL